MALETYIRSHSPKCLAEIKKRLADRDLKIPKTETEFSFLQQYWGCGGKCAAWVRGVTDDGRMVEARSLKVYTKTAADEELRKLNLPDAPVTKHTIEAAAKIWIRELGLKEGRPDNTIESYQIIINKLIAYGEKTRKRYLTDIGPDQINDIREYWMNEEKAAVTTRYARTRIFSSFFNWCVKRDFIKRNPIRQITGISTHIDPEHVSTLPLDPDGGSKVYDAFMAAIHPTLATGTKNPRKGALATRPDHFYAICELMKATGLRRCDAVEFTPDDMEWTERCAIWVKRQRKIKRTRHDGGEVTCYIPLPLAEKLSRLEKISGPYIFLDTAQCERGKNGDWKTNPYMARNLNLIMTEIATAAGLTGIRPHRFRDQFALDMWLKTKNWDIVAELLGHESADTTRRYYAPWCKARKTAMIDTLYPANVIQMPPPGTRKSKKQRAG